MSSGLWPHLVEGLLHVVRRPLRSGLTAATCAVAIAVTVNVISLSYGLDEDIRKDISRFGRLTIDVGRSPVIRPGTARAVFGEAELERIRTTVAGLDAVVVPLRTEQVTATGTAEVARTVLAAVTPDYPRTLDLRMSAGRWFGPNDHGFSACVLDRSAAMSLFAATTPEVSPGSASGGSGAAEWSPASVLGRKVGFSGEGHREATVVGVLEDPMTYRSLFEAFDEGRSSRTLVGSLLSFRNVYVPADAIASPDLTMVHVVLPDDARLEAARARLEKIWPASSDALEGGKIAPVTVFTRKVWMDALGGATQNGAFLGNLVWILICLVACIMISTLNLVTIRERYDELAIRRCEGARKSQLMAQVTAEGVTISLVGGLLGLPLGYLGAEVLRRIVSFPFRFDPRYAAVAIAVAAGLGLISSVVPARRAAGLDPAAVLTRRVT